jgi:hypothetical protein
MSTCWDNTKRVKRIYQIEAARRAVRDGRTQTLLGLLLLYRGFNAAFLKDRIYALCGLANDSGADALAVELDCKIKDAELHRELALKMLNRNQYLDVLSVPRAPEPSALGTLPSWVPDRSVTDFTTSLRMPSPSGMALLEFQVTPKDVQKFVQISTHRMAIGLAGEIVDHAVEIGDVHSHQVEGLVTMVERLMCVPKQQAVFNGRERIAQTRSSSQYPPTGEDLLDVYWQTLAAR